MLTAFLYRQPPKACQRSTLPHDGAIQMAEELRGAAHFQMPGRGRGPWVHERYLETPYRPVRVARQLVPP